MEFIYDQLRIYDYIVIIMLYKVLMNDKQTHKLFILTEAAHLWFSFVIWELDMKFSTTTTFFRIHACILSLQRILKLNIQV